MLQIETLIRQNPEEFISSVMELISNNKEELISIFSKKTEEAKKKKNPKTVCHFKVFGKHYNSNIFKNNYENFLLDTSKILPYEAFKPILKGFIRENESDFPEVHDDKSALFKLHNNGVVSAYSATEKKIGHIKELCNLMGVSLTITN